VGKTTISASLAARPRPPGRSGTRAHRRHRRAAWQMHSESGAGQRGPRVPDEAFADAGARPKGELYAAMLDMSESWDALVRRHAPDPRTANEILANPLYRNITRRFAPGPRLHRDGAALRAS